ncbi:uncharacterized protein LOC117648055 [Thrips palmi]|uniref:Uncharacterized protein LOC117648055 n=1 Tax=Thrips palmi TaxID=161013 RepID=A0A6P8ZQM4_THRPL|nr:uncharacterized protein LOC117648055 [Thrips palmi]
MATQYSVDPNINSVVLTVLFLEDGWRVNVVDFEAQTRVYVGGDTLTLKREDNDQEQLAVVLGVGGTEAEAEEQARVYVRRLCKWHGQPEDHMAIFGHDLAQSQLFNGQESDSSN